MAVTKLFSLYKDSYVRQLPDEQGGDDIPMGEEHLAKTAKNEFLLQDAEGYSVRIKKRGTNFYHRCVCWLEDRGFPCIGTTYQTRRQASNEFATAISEALLELGIENHNDHYTVLLIQTHASKCLPLRSNLVRSVLAEVAELGCRVSPGIWEREAPLYTTDAFDPPTEIEEEFALPGYDQIDNIPPLDGQENFDRQEDLGAPPAHDDQPLPVNDAPPAYEDEAPPAYDEAVADQGNVRDPDNPS